MDERCIIVSKFYASADSLPRSALRRGPNLRATGRKQNHRAIAELDIVRTAEIKHKDIGGNISADANGAARIERHRAIAPGESVSVQGSYAYAQGCCDGPRTRRTRRSTRGQGGRKSGHEELLLGGERIRVAIWSRPNSPIDAELFELAIDLRVAADRFESRKFEHVGKA